MQKREPNGFPGHSQRPEHRHSDQQLAIRPAARHHPTSEQGAGSSPLYPMSPIRARFDCSANPGSLVLAPYWLLLCYRPGYTPSPLRGMPPVSRSPTLEPEGHVSPFVRSISTIPPRALVIAFGLASVMSLLNSLLIGLLIGLGDRPCL